MKALIKRNLKGRNILFIFVFTSIIYMIMLTITIPQVMLHSEGMKLLDMMPTGYSVEYANSLLDTLGREGRHAYLYEQIPVDMIYPACFGITYCLTTAYFLKLLGKLGGHLFNLCLVPLFSGLFDYCENIGIMTMLNIYPDKSNLLIQVTNVFSILKSAFTTICFISLILLLMVIGKRKIFQPNA